MDKALEGIEAQVNGGRNFEQPPLEKWHPDLSGDIPIVIASDGSWYHEGGRIERESLVRLFASILRREDDGEYYLVTPVEKWRIEVESHALLVTDVEPGEEGGQPVLRASLNTGREIVLGPCHRLFLDPDRDGVAAVEVAHGLTALLTRAAWYRLVEMADEVGGVPTVHSAGMDFELVAGA